MRHLRDLRDLQTSMDVLDDSHLVWRGDDGSFIVAEPGEFEAEADAEADERYRLAGTVSQFRHDA